MIYSLFRNGFRAKWIKAYRVHILWIVFMGLLAHILWSTGMALPCVFRTNCGDATLLNYWHENRVWGGVVSRPVPENGTWFLPPGCPCEGHLCEVEKSCENDQYHSSFHHNIFPSGWRSTLTCLMVGNLLCNYVLEMIVMRVDNRKHQRAAEATCLFESPNDERSSEDGELIMTH
eukprot:Protomagalhaensia_wolfi_Nauph_80__2384@NODE_2569_length_1051_cov_7_491107_g2009_i0_p1_GENE_NODE_2569_length_1051_cov_7_491107_g2009_i0NODE_2569_length_1051_cov_7_491107_g2009_i0_p1_ORF_typecomplete_len175_score10_36YccF/PF03733_13/6YccF/PF03733_13/17Thg1/PF04446_12/0_31_NODE_2569_length_1051_cov_7_491107_g2009_i0464988